MDTDELALAVSNSDINAFLDCRRKSLFNFVLEVGNDSLPIGAAPRGTRVHDAIEVMFSSDPEHEGADPRQHFEDLAMADVKLCEDAGAPPWKMDRLYEDILAGRKMVSDYLDWVEETGDTVEWLPVATEPVLSYLPSREIWHRVMGVEATEQMFDALERHGYPGGIRFKGRLDLVEQHVEIEPSNPNAFRIRATDFKTTARTFNVDDGFLRSSQGFWYLMLLEQAATEPDPRIDPNVVLAMQAARESTSTIFRYLVLQQARSKSGTTNIRPVEVPLSRTARQTRSQQMFAAAAGLVWNTISLWDRGVGSLAGPEISPDLVRHPPVLPGGDQRISAWAQYAYPTPGDHCTWCDFKLPCEVTNDSQESAVALINVDPDFRVGGRMDRYHS